MYAFAAGIMFANVVAPVGNIILIVTGAVLAIL